MKGEAMLFKDLEIGDKFIRYSPRFPVEDSVGHYLWMKINKIKYFEKIKIGGKSRKGNVLRIFSDSYAQNAISEHEEIIKIV